MCNLPFCPSPPLPASYLEVTNSLTGIAFKLSTISVHDPFLLPPAKGFKLITEQRINDSRKIYIWGARNLPSSHNARSSAIRKRLYIPLGLGMVKPRSSKSELCIGSLIKMLLRKPATDCITNYPLEMVRKSIGKRMAKPVDSLIWFGWLASDELYLAGTYSFVLALGTAKNLIDTISSDVRCQA